MSAIYVHQHGPASVLQHQPLTHFSLTAAPPPGHARIRVAFCGLNFIDTYYRSGLYKRPLPLVCGDEGSGVIEAVTSSSSDSVEEKWAVGQEVVFFRGSTGAYSTHAIVPLQELFAVPAGLSLAQAASLLLQGGTAHYLSTGCVTFFRKDGEEKGGGDGYPAGLRLSSPSATPPMGCYHHANAVCLVHAAAGGTGLLLTQMLKNVQKVQCVIGCCRGAEKCRLALSIGCCDVVINTEDNSVWGLRTPAAEESNEGDPANTKLESTMLSEFGTSGSWSDAVRKVVAAGGGTTTTTSSKCVDVIFDGVGAATFDEDLTVLRERGSMITFGNASGAVPPLQLTAHGSISLQRPTLKDYTKTPQETSWRMGEVLRWAGTGAVRLSEGLVFPLAKAQEAQESLEQRKTTGKVLLDCREL